MKHYLLFETYYFVYYNCDYIISDYLWHIKSQECKSETLIVILLTSDKIFALKIKLDSGYIKQ